MMMLVGVAKNYCAFDVNCSVKNWYIFDSAPAFSFYLVHADSIPGSQKYETTILMTAAELEFVLHILV
jgi:hypothetical protein